MSLPTISLALIVKNEEKNLRRLLDSVKDCFHEIVLVDTGSTDKTKDIALEYGCKIYDFEWVDSFSKARNFAFSKCTKDYIAWLDADDSLRHREAFIKWRDTAMPFNGAWLATYNYALDAAGKPIISFARERVFRRNLNPTWVYDIHEGVTLRPEWQPNYAVTWAVDHLRDMDDIKADKSRNLNILKKMPNKDARMKFYYGKELHEAGFPYEAIQALEEVIKEPNLEHHDRLLSYQYGAYAATQMYDQTKDEYQEEKDRYFNKALDFALLGLKHDPNRAEFHTAVGDLYIKRNQLHLAIPHFAAAKACTPPQSRGSKYEGAIYSFVNSYGELPSLQLSKIYLYTGQLEKAKREALECVALYKNEDALKVVSEVDRISSYTNLDNNQAQAEDIIITCPPQSAYEFDEELYKTKPMGGSETALIQMAKYLKKNTKRNVKVFNMRKDKLVSESGVEYIPNSQVGEYLSKNKPHTHIAWRHNIKLTNSRTYLWCHDLTTQTVESTQNFDKILCLSEFHRDYVEAIQGVPPEKIIVTRNGLTPEKFNFERKPKNPNKVVWMSSPDRGLDNCILVMDELRKEFVDLELHVYYGLDNLEKYGLKALADKLKSMMNDRPWINYHGFTEQNKMYHEVSDAVMWLHPCNFIETFCITALEMLELGIFPVTRKLGALQNTLADAEKKGHAIMLNHDCVTAEDIEAYRAAAADVLRNKKWQGITFDIEHHDWEKVASEWQKFMEL